MLAGDVLALYIAIVKTFFVFIMDCGLQVCLSKMENMHTEIYISLFLNSKGYVPEY